MRPGRLAVPIALAAVLALSTPAGAQLAGGDLSREEASALAGAAPDDPAALAQLEAATSIDGQPVELGRTLDTEDPAELDARLAALERALASTASEPGDAASARDTAAEIVAGFDDVEEVGPVEVEDPAGSSAFDLDVGSLWLPLLILAVIAGGFLAYRLARNREAAGRLAASEGGAEVEAPQSELERRAAEAERAGAFGEALRLRYGIALRELQEIGRVPGGPSVTASRVSRELADPRADRLVGTFERVAYGGREAVADDAREAREGWPALVDTVRTRENREAPTEGSPA
jgi:hypothetical protein